MTNPIEIQAFSSNNQIHIDDDIGRDGITAKQIKEELSNHRGSIEIHINSAGGAVTEGIAIYNMLKAYSGKKTVFIDSLAASMASVIAMAGDTILMPSNGLMMIHNPWGVSTGQAIEHRKTADLLDVMKASMLAAYISKTGLEESEVSQLMDQETWMNGEDCFEKGFIDGLTDSVSQDAVNAKFERVCVAKQAEIKQSQHSFAADVRQSAAKICEHRKIPQPTNLFNSQQTTPKHYSEIKNV
ncbi:Clp protease ClpP [Alteromonas sp. 1_MG-2023]|uniref:head maturation protease, ClpP-related n=1 Tax=Alteromonas sp. 1_MG-2023 TaxID=3062669 RepID=UPI0026E2BF81|nr:head maturation protease, ClpP-related [Alteromonas sp. 1_MG-2023]MDO6565832.1 Clp protease ClpP [Alteromonas sp. 1_MG-2023]